MALDALTSLTGGGGLSASGGSAAPSAAYGGSSGSMFDSSGWAVSFGSGDAAATGSAGKQPGLSAYLPYIAVAAVVLFLWKQKKR